MSSDVVHYDLEDGVATVRIDDGKRNALSPDVLRALFVAFRRAESDRAIVVLTGRDSVFSAGFDLHVMKRGGPAALRMLRLGFSLPATVLGHPSPVVAACNGHAFAMGVFLLLSCDHVVGCRGEGRISANEVAIGLTMPRVAAAMLEHRLHPAAFQRAVTLAAEFDPDSAREAGFLDELVEPEELLERARARARELAALDMRAHAASKRRIRARLIRRIRRSVPLDLADAVLFALRR